MQNCAPPSPALPGGTFTRGVSRRGSRMRSGTPALYGQAGVRAGEVAEIRGAGGEAEELVHGELETRGGRHEIEPELGVVATRQLDETRGWQHAGPRLLGQIAERDAERVVPDARGVVVHEQRAKARHALDDAGDGLLLCQVLE